ncbi:glycosyltransferase family 2 protein [Ileibacterium valens]|uniref:Teichuronic acid biosynthesis glycosyl transferase n=1 Tax=Ileibacterium valens TaxID=1862668 RepID=A0A1U7NEY7_9FIRM|nr:glycosyltransferase family 2 protein [Ileibacterium valens]OLU38468.1 teichuronic acid biosynthesis glycosyl transferase [Erysipelotrichaceae bacterium NYU-BL-F16]OLU38503.1 teichuronic acid biosynthesis glycosyl transferase [Ileibacterium valens]OLU38817.1 teichuronic acid biosynthesis glycosyl transferase [Erysipelotrichaceae bacterium NYU-BL-E8]
MQIDLVSIITPAYNAEKFIGYTIESVINQTYPYWEMLIVDDGSTDKTEDIVKKYSNKDQRIKYYKQNNSGSASARNNGIRKSKGRYIALLDADDVWRPDFLKKQIQLLKDKNTVCAFSSYGRIDETSSQIGKPTMAKEKITSRDMKVMNYIGCLTGLYDSNKYGKIFLDESLNSIRDDYYYWFTIVSLDNVAYGNKEILADYRVLKNSTTGNKIKLIRKQYDFYRNHLDENFIEAFVNVIRWGVTGIYKFR